VKLYGGGVLQLRTMKVKSHCILIGSGIVVGVAYLYLSVFIAPIVLAKRDLKNPAMWKVPATLPDLATSTSGMKLFYFGWQFEVPWKDLDPSKTKPIGKSPWQWQVIGFHSGRRILFIRRPAKHWSKVLFPSTDSYTERAYMKWLVGADASSDYAFMRAMLEGSPDELSLFSFRGEGARLNLLLMFKSIEIVVHDAKSGIFMIDSSDSKGFQYGNPESGQARIDDVLYSDRGAVEFRFWSCPPNKAPISQADINRVIQTAKLLDREPKRRAADG
jgi:hypothetical protein